MREQIPQPDWAFSARTQGHFRWSQISVRVQRELEFSQFELTYSDGGKLDGKETKNQTAAGTPGSVQISEL